MKSEDFILTMKSQTTYDFDLSFWCFWVGEFRYAKQYKLIFVPRIVLCRRESRLPSFEHFLNVELVNYPCSNESTEHHRSHPFLFWKELSSLAITRGGRYSKMASGRGRTHVLLTGSPGIISEQSYEHFREKDRLKHLLQYLLFTFARCWQDNSL